MRVKFNGKELDTDFKTSLEFLKISAKMKMMYGLSMVLQQKRISL